MREYLLGPGFLAFLTFWPGVITLGIGIAGVRLGRGGGRL
jgi:hypothetical protein